MLSEITIEFKGENIEVLYDALYLANIFLYSVIDKKDFIDVTKSKINWDYIDEKALSSYQEFPTVKIILENKVITEKINELKNILENFNIKQDDYVISIKDYIDYDWLKKWKEFYSVIDVGKFQIIPIWEKSSYEYFKIPIYINPSVAFGTGEHESTKIALFLLSELKIGFTVLDVGTGSGILGIAAAKLGANKIHLIDVDINALQNTNENVVENDVQSKCKIYQSSFLSNVNEKFDLIISNMTADLNLELLKNLKKVCKKGTKIILSGIILERKEKVINSYFNEGFNLILEKNIGEWVGLTFEYK
ncbi:MAG TPA: 50S ribosomal protein L11 methyltransferase [Clostridiales bacterium]|nr:50S ribosomal protein L11 methyltransferase [Clostridiales bacterium]